MRSSSAEVSGSGSNPAVKTDEASRFVVSAIIAFCEILLDNLSLDACTLVTVPGFLLFFFCSV